ncbi:MAG: hypothetical protein WB762_32420 [Candidatus Sulfotelmatobacter sp.]
MDEDDGAADDIACSGGGSFLWAIASAANGKIYFGTPQGDQLHRA